MATLCVRRLRVPGSATAYRRFLSVAATGEQLRSHVEVERKFILTEELRSTIMCSDDCMVDPFRLRGKKVVYERWGKVPAPLFKVFRLPDVFLRDTYYDLNDQLSSKGIWVRHRNSSPNWSARFLTVEACRSGRTLEAKVRLQGDFTDSQFHEIEGKHEVAALLDEKLPGVKLDDLDELADLKTFRRTWKVMNMPAKMRIVFDQSGEMLPSAYEIFPPESMLGQKFEEQDFVHAIGEIEITKEVVGGTSQLEHDGLRREAAKQMDLEVEAFMRTHRDTFDTWPKPKGKLTAYFEWKKEAERRSKKQD